MQLVLLNLLILNLRFHKNSLRERDKVLTFDFCRTTFRRACSKQTVIQVASSDATDFGNLKTTFDAPNPGRSIKALQCFVVSPRSIASSVGQEQ